MKRRTLLMAFAAFSACGDPYDDSTPSPELPGRDAGFDVATDASDAATSIDASDDATDAGADGDPCDRDRDGFRAKTGACGGDDCDDEDPRAHPDAGFVADKPTGTTNGDWNCNGKVETDVAVNVKCNDLPLADCDGIAGLRNSPPCGAVGTFVTCVKDVIACKESGNMARVLSCR